MSTPPFVGTSLDILKPRLHFRDVFVNGQMLSNIMILSAETKSNQVDDGPDTVLAAYEQHRCRPFNNSNHNFGSKSRP